jgi:DNA relaxase NicK
MDFKCTRIDLAIDDYTKSLEKEVFVQACDDDFHHGFQTYGEQWQKTRAKPKGWTFYMGSFGSDKLYRFYNKSVESNGEIDSYRLEGQYRDGNSQVIFRHLVEQPKNDSSFLQDVASIVCSCIDFYTGDKDNKERLDWWENFRKMIKASDLKLGCGRSKTTLERSFEWLEKSVVRTLATVEMFYEQTGQDFGEFLNASLELGRTKIRDVHENLVKSALSQLGVNDSVSYADVCNGYF